MMYSNYNNDGMMQDPLHRRQQAVAGPPAPDHAPSYDADGRRVRRPVHRRTIDHTSTAIRYIQTRMWQRDGRDSTILQPTPAASLDLLPPVAYPECPASSFATKFVHASTNKVRCSINKVVWTPQGRRLITGSQSGEFTLWNGTSFNFEMILQAHDEAIGAMVWSHNENWMVTGDEGGWIKYWQQNMNNVKANKGHKEAVRDLSFSSTDLKFCSCSDDGFVKVWDFARCQEERSLSGHGWDVKSVDWHPQKSLLVSGAKDHLVKLWDAKNERELCTLHGHKNTVLCVRWNGNGNWVLTASKDQIIKLFDIRTLKEVETYRGHQKDVTCLAWHPFHEELFVSGSYDGTILHWLVGHELPQAEVLNAHENSVWDLAWHPMGHILCSGSNDHTTKFWCRNRPGDPARDKASNTYVGNVNEQAMPTIGNTPAAFPTAEGPVTPGAFVSGGPVRGDGAIPGVGMAMPLVQSSIETPPGLLPRGPHPPSAPYPSMISSSQPILQQVPVQPHHQAQQPQQQPPLLPIQPSQHLQQVQMLPPPPPLPPPRPMAAPLPQQPPLPHGSAPTSVPSEPLLSRPGLPQSSAHLVMSGGPMVGMQGLTPQLQPPLVTTPAIGLPSGQSLPLQQYQGSNTGGEFIASGGIQSGGMSVSGGQPYRPPNMMPPLGATSYAGLPGPPLLPSTLPPTPDNYSMMDVRTAGNSMGMQMNMGMNLPSHSHRPGQPPL